jgi:hypothetical protein
MRSFGDRLGDVREAMEALAATLQAEVLNRVGFRLYEHFGPTCLLGLRGWKQRGSYGLIRPNQSGGCRRFRKGQVRRHTVAGTKMHAAQSGGAIPQPKLLHRL